MKLLRYGPAGAEKPGVLDAQGRVRDLSAEIGDLAGPSVSVEALARLQALDLNALPIVDGRPRLGACLADTPNFYAIGLNYARHAAETKQDIPHEPILFSKATSCLSGPDDAVAIPKGARHLDWEVELGVVIGREASDIAEADALDHVAGYCVVNDVSERFFQSRRAGQWIKGKSAPGFGPVGPWLVTRDEIADPQALGLWLEVNGERMQDSSTSDMIFGVAFLVSYMSQFMRLRVGDIIATGTPEGVGVGMDPKRFLKPGDEMRLGVDGLGEQRQRVAGRDG